MKHRRVLKIGSLLLVLALVFSFACAPTGEVEQPEKVITIGTMNLPTGLNVFQTTGNVYYGLIAWVYDSLYELGPEDVARPNLAKNIEISADRLTYTITIRDDATWWDGTPLTAEDVAFTYNYIVDNDLSWYASICSQIQGWKVIDDYTVEMTLKEQVNPDWLKYNPFYIVPIIPKHVWQDIAPEEALGELPLEMTHGSGPYQVVEFVPDEYIRLDASQFAKEVLGANIDEYIIKGYADASVMLQDFKAGNIDAVYGGVDFKMAKALEPVSEVTIADLAAMVFDQVVFNCWDNAWARGGDSHPHPALKDIRVKQALDWCLDEEVAAEIAHGKFGIPGCAYLAPYFKDFANSELDCRGYDLDKASQILDEAGYLDTDGDGIRETAEGLPLKFDVYVDAGTPYELDVATVWSRETEKVGIQLDISALDSETLWDVMNPNGDFDMAFWGWAGDPDPHYLLCTMTCEQAAPGGWSESGYCNPELDEAYEQAALVQTREERRALYWKMQELIQRDVPYITWAYYGNLCAFRNDKVVMDLELLRGLGSYGIVSKMFAITADTVS
ncbi:MAG: peptide ABC transporter substrate-binding protein [Dehalococcoidia bacterium]|nr:peptide ABC transporter substrate-binding protein [Dehalococcoidia bacterium]